MSPTSTQEPSEDAVAAAVVHAHERTIIGKPPGEPLVGLALSGGGIRSATFGLGVLQGLKRLGLFDRLDYVSTVSGGGYIGSWLQAVLAADPLASALDLQPQEPREVRFLRGFSNYLTPRLGLFSGDTWAAVGVSLRNLILTFTILSLSLAVPLFVPWLVVLLFWTVVAWHLSAGIVSCAIVVAVTTVLLAFPTFTGTVNMAQPTADGGWTKSGASSISATHVYVLAVVPSLMAFGLASGVVWTQATGASRVMSDGLFIGAGATAYAAAWLVGLCTGYVFGGHRPRTGDPRPVARAAWAGFILVLTAFAAGVVGTAVWLYGSRAFMGLVGDAPMVWRASLLIFPLGVVSFFLCVTTHLGLAGRRMSEETREWWGRVGGVQLLAALLLTVVGVIALAGPHLPEFVGNRWTWFQEHQATIGSVLAALWAALTGAGVVAGKSERTRAGEGNVLLEWAGRLAPVSFVVGYLLILSALIHRIVVVRPFDLMLPGLERLIQGYATGVLGAAALQLPPPPDPIEWLGVASIAGQAVALAVLAWWVSWLVDLNQFSLHNFYRNRLVRCFLGATRERMPNPFTGFDSDDDPPLASLGRRVGRPYPIFNTALNLVGGKNLAWQQRKAASFAFTPGYCGFEYRVDEQGEDGDGYVHAYRRTAAHAGDDKSLTVGLAMATSGAAASPNMGYHSSPTLAFLMTVFNVRLGWWLRNPSPKVEGSWTGSHGGLSLRELLYELLGMTTDERKWVYLSDGGHFENLGVYELVRRRCRFIIACDAGQDGAVTFGDLGNAIEKCRADFGVDIEIDVGPIRPLAPGRLSDWHCAVGRIRYDHADPQEITGTLIYIKSSVTGDEPADVQRYGAEHPAFPHEPTSDQFFDESQFESYRALGCHIAHEVFGPAVSRGAAAGAVLDAMGGPMAPLDLDTQEIFTRLTQVWSKPAPAPADGVHRHSATLTRIWTTMRSTPELRFLDEQMFPEMPSLIRLPFTLVSEIGPPPSIGGRLPVNYWLPESDDERRAGFYACMEMLQLMEDVFIEYNLDRYHDHIDNRGWMNLFQHWAWSGMLCATWAITGSMFDPRFQRFCRMRLDLRPGRPNVVQADASLALPSGDQWRRLDAAAVRTHMADWQESAGLNFWEAELLSKFLGATCHAAAQLYPVVVKVESPRRSDGNPLCFNVGYLVGNVASGGAREHAFSLHYLRIQNHLRKMGLAREALKGLQAREGMPIAVVPPEWDEGAIDGRLSDEGLPLPAAVRYLERLVRSLPRVGR